MGLVPDLDRRIIATTIERVQLGLMLELLGMALGLVLSRPSGIPLPAGIIALNGVVLAIGGATLIALRRGRIPDRRIHAVAAAAWLLAPITSLASFVITDDRNLVFPILIELALASIMQTSTRMLVISTGCVVTAYIALELPALDAGATLHIATVGGFAIATAFVSRNIRRSMDTAIEREDAQTAAEDERERLRDQFVHAQRMDAVGTMAAGLAHDMNNIIAGILGLAEVAADDVQDPALREDLDAIAREAARAADLTRGLLAFARRGQYRKAVVAVEAILDEVEPLLSRMFAGRVTLERRGSTDAAVDVDAAQLGQAIVNLCINGADAMSNTGVLTITSSVIVLSGPRGALAAGTYASIAVRDHGRGIDDAIKARIFEPFFTTKQVGAGTGLGLAMVYGTVHAHGGAIEVASALGDGSTFTILLPVSKRASVARDVGRDSSRPKVATRLALVVDDEPVVRAVTTRILRQMGLSVVGAGDGKEALDVFAARKDEISIVVLDMSMPVMGGAECLRKIREISKVPVVIASGYANEAETQSLLALGHTAFLEKPFSADAMRTEVSRMLGTPR